MKSPSNTIKAAAPNILVVEDELVVKFSIEALLKSDGYKNLSFAADGEAALSLVAEKPPALIILDAMMPKLDGARVIQRLKESPETAEIPIMVVTSLSGSSLDFFLKSANAVLQKPFDRTELLSHVRRLVGPADRARQKAAAQ